VSRTTRLAELEAANARLREALAVHHDAAGVRAVFADCHALISTALTAVEIGAYPGPAWRTRAGEMKALLARLS
jgi:hypothetical protein